MGHGTVPRQIENPHTQVVSNSKPFLDNLEKVQQQHGNNKSKKFINSNLANVALPDRSLKMKRGSQPATSRNLGNNTQILSPKNAMGDSLASSKRQKSTIKQRTAAGDFVLYDTKAPVKVIPGIRFPHVNSPKRVEMERKQSQSLIGEEGFGASASSSQIQIDQQQSKDIITFPTNTQSSMRNSQ